MMETLEERVFEAQEMESKLEVDRQRQAEEHSARVRCIQEQKERIIREEEEKKEEMKRKAEEKRIKFEQMQEKWAAAQVQLPDKGDDDSSLKGKAGAPSNKKKKSDTKRKRKTRDTEFYESEEDEDAKMMRMIGADGGDGRGQEIDFGNSDDDSTAERFRNDRSAENSAGTGRSNRRSNQGIFDSDDELEEPSTGHAKKRLKKSTELDDTDDEMNDLSTKNEDPAATPNRAAGSNGRVANRVIIDSDEEL